MSILEINKSINNKNNKYSQSTLSKFDIIGSYFVNLYYNEFYIKAKNLKTQGTYNNITDAYKNLLSSYVDFSKQHDFFKQIVKGIHTYCISTTRYTTMSHKECVDFMVSEFVPDHLWNSLREQQKNKLFHESLINCIKDFTEKIIIQYLHVVIDNHDNNENIVILQDLFLNIILLEKDRIFSKFINPDQSAVNLFKNKIQEIITEKKKIHNNNELLLKKNKVLEDLNKKNSIIIIELQKQNKLLNEENKILKLNEEKLNKKLLQYVDVLRSKYSSINANKDNKKYNNKDNNIKVNTVSNISTNNNKLYKSQTNNDSNKVKNIIQNNKYPNNPNKKLIDNESIDNESIDNKSVDNESVDNESVDNESVDNESVDNKSVDNKSVDNKSVDNKSVDNELNNEFIDDNNSVDDEFESYFNTNNIPIINNLEFDKSEDYSY